MKRKNNPSLQQSTAQSLGSLIKSCRDIMRKDKGLNTDLDRLPMLTWILFLKFLDDMEQVRETEAEIEGLSFHPIIEPPYRWRDWAEKADGITGDTLINFINNEKSIRPDGSEGPGLFFYLQSLHGANGGDRRDVIRNVFRETGNRMQSGYLLRDVINKINNIHFTSSDEISTLGRLYESMLQEMRDAAGENGEFYTPRPVVKFIVSVAEPKLGEVILDPACGTGGFLTEAYEHLKHQCKTTEDFRQLQRNTLFGIEAKQLPYLLCQMNLLLHGVESPNIDPLNALRFPLREIGEAQRVDVIITNPPFGGAEERGILGNFPEDKQSSDTALLFLQLIMRKLKRPEKNNGNAGRAAVIVPNSTLFGDGICARIKKELIQEFNLYAVIRLPKGVFSPYTDIPTNILFFNRKGPTDKIWYYEHSLPQGKKNYSKTQPIQFEDFTPCIDWWKNKIENDNAWLVDARDIIENSFNLDIKNPKSKIDFSLLPPEQISRDILNKEQRVIEIMNRIHELIQRNKT
jgi:type I restriction enzyme M protein